MVPLHSIRFLSIHLGWLFNCIMCTLHIYYVFDYFVLALQATALSIDKRLLNHFNHAHKHIHRAKTIEKKSKKTENQSYLVIASLSLCFVSFYFKRAHTIICSVKVIISTFISLLLFVFSLYRSQSTLVRTTESEIHT